MSGALPIATGPEAIDLEHIKPGRTMSQLPDRIAELEYRPDGLGQISIRYSIAGHVTVSVQDDYANHN